MPIPTPTIAAAALAITVAGCSTHQAYPPGWPSLAAEPQACAQLQGDFEARGTSARSAFISFAELVFGTNGAPYVSRVRLKPSENRRIEIEIIGSDGRVLPSPLTGATWRCKKGTLPVSVGAKWVGAVNAGGAGIAKERTSLEMHVASGHLIVKEKIRTTGVVNLIPWNTTDEYWYSFPMLGADR